MPFDILYVEYTSKANKHRYCLPVPIYRPTPRVFLFCLFLVLLLCRSANPLFPIYCPPPPTLDYCARSMCMISLQSWADLSASVLCDWDGGWMGCKVQQLEAQKQRRGRMCYAHVEMVVSEAGKCVIETQFRDTERERERRGCTQIKYGRKIFTNRTRRSSRASCGAPSIISLDRTNGCPFFVYARFFVFFYSPHTQNKEEDVHDSISHSIYAI